MEIMALTYGPLDPEVLSFFAKLLSYPDEDYLEVAENCYEKLARNNDFQVFLEFIRPLVLIDIQSYYTEMFELNYHISPYVGYYLFGESYLRSTFLVELKKRFRSHGYTVEGELPDHFSVLLDFVSKFPNEVLSQEIVQSALLPSLKRIIWTKIRPEDKPQSTSAGLAFYSLFLSIYNYLSKPEDKIQTRETVSLPVHSSPVPDNSGIDQWIRKSKKEE